MAAIEVNGIGGAPGNLLLRQPGNIRQSRGQRGETARLERRRDGLEVKRRTHFYPMARIPALIHLEAVLDGVTARCYGLLIERVHWINFFKFTGAVDVADIEGQDRVAHPETHLLGCRENKEHALITPHGLTEH